MYVADVGDETVVPTMVEAALARFGRIAMLIDDAADRQQTPLTAISPAEWRHITGIVVDGAFICVRPCVPHMIAGGGGTVANIGGASAHTAHTIAPFVPTEPNDAREGSMAEWIQWCEPATRLVLRIGPPATIIEREQIRGYGGG